MGQEGVGERKGQRLRRRSESGIHIEFAFWPGNCRAKTGSFRFLNRQIEIQGLELADKSFGVRSFCCKTYERAAFGGVNGWVNGVLPPLNEKWQETCGGIRERHNLPLQKFSIGPLT